MHTTAARLDFARLTALTFEPPDPVRFPALQLARDTLREGANGPIILNAANEIAVDAYLSSKIGFLDIVRVVENVMQEVVGSLRSGNVPARFEDICAIDERARDVARRLCGGAR
jgi:1-deoxy-D-xylulose-5-phosphate reductoisomerase